MSTTVTIELSMQVSYSVELTTKAAKAITADYVDPNEKWTDEAESALQCAFTDAEPQISHAIRTELPKSIDVRIDSQPALLSLQSSDVDVDAVEVEQ